MNDDRQAGRKEIGGGGEWTALREALLAKAKEWRYESDLRTRRDEPGDAQLAHCAAELEALAAAAPAPAAPMFKRSVSELREFIAKRPKVCQTLIDCWEPIQRIFGAGTSIHIALESDPEDTLCIHADIQWEGDWRDAQKRLDEFDKTWWLNRVGEMDGALMFNFELVQP